jgi:hypothetical protein
VRGGGLGACSIAHGGGETYDVLRESDGADGCTGYDLQSLLESCSDWDEVGS